jgi:ABC-type bacteriocin/lantibiotic exporter with double-glycine peptidase domain
MTALFRTKQSIGFGCWHRVFFLVYIFDFIIRLLRGYFVDIAGKKSDILISSNIFERVIGMKQVNRPVSIGAFASNLNLHLNFL